MAVARGRPKAVPKVDPTKDEILVAEYISKHICNIIGCAPKNHMDEAREIISLFSRSDIRLVKTGS